MALVIKLFGILLLFAGISLIFKPEIIFDWILNNAEGSYIYIIAIVVRLTFGILFIAVSKESRYPSLIKFFGFLFIIAAIIFIFIGQEHFQKLISSIISTFKPFARVSGLFSIAFGSFLIYAFSRNTKLEQK